MHLPSQSIFVLEVIDFLGIKDERGLKLIFLLFFLIQIKHPMSDDWYLDHCQTPKR